MSGRDDDDDWAMQRADELLLMISTFMISKPDGHLELIHNMLAAQLRIIRAEGVDEGIGRTWHG